MHRHHHHHPHAGHEHGAEAHSPQATAAQALKDPVCGMTVTETSPHRAEHAGHPYWFCSAGCRGKFLADPSRYVVAQGEAPASPQTAPEAGAEGTIYTCPMHPEIRQDHPGNCPWVRFLPAAPIKSMG